MPNWVYNRITTDEKNLYLLSEISKVGLARYYRPMPEAIQNTVAPTKITEDFTEKDLNELLAVYGFSNWYDWSIHNWGTKWGCCQNHMENNSYIYRTPWGPLKIDLLELLANDIPNFTYIWEEEQGYGEKWICKNGELKMEISWNMYTLFDISG